MSKFVTIAIKVLEEELRSKFENDICEPCASTGKYMRCERCPLEAMFDDLEEIEKEKRKKK